MTPATQLQDTIGRPIELPAGPRDNLLRLRELYEFAWNAASYAAPTDLVTTQRLKNQRAEAMMLVCTLAENIMDPIYELREERQQRKFGLERLRAMVDVLLAELRP